MPPKLQVDESFAFLFTCIEASGCKVDFKLVGDATDLQPAAARMRYTRLRKAVEAGQFKGATLIQPNIVVSASLSQLANPQSRRLGNSLPYGGQQQQRMTISSDEETPRSPSRKRADRPISFDAEEEEEEAETQKVTENHLGQNPTKRRQVPMTTDVDPDDQNLFFPDTSQSSRVYKKIKRRDSDVGEEEYQNPMSGKDTKRIKESSRRTTASKGSSQQQSQPQRSPPRVSTSSEPRSGEHCILPVNASNHAAATIEHLSNNTDQAAILSRKKQSANTAAGAAYSVGVRTGRWAPHPDDVNTRNNHDTYVHTNSQANQPNQTSPFGDFGQGTNAHGHSRSSVQNTWHTTNPNPSISTLNHARPGIHFQPITQMNIPPPTYHSQPPQNVILSQNHQAPDQAATGMTQTTPTINQTISTAQCPLTSTTDPHSHQFPQSNPLPHPSHQPPIRPNHLNPRRFHPASVFEGFQAPLPMSQPLPAMPPRNPSDMSLLQKMRLEKETGQRIVDEKANRNGETDSSGRADVMKDNGGGRGGTKQVKRSSGGSDDRSEELATKEGVGVRGHGALGGGGDLIRQSGRQCTTSSGTMVADATQGDAPESVQRGLRGQAGGESKREG